MEDHRFEGFSKIPRLQDANLLCITEKIDGTNGQIFILPAVDVGNEDFVVGAAVLLDAQFAALHALAFKDGHMIAAGSRSRWLTLQNDNFGFANWVHQNANELFKLGPGRHFGEWWGLGIQRGYDQLRKRFSLFNVARWNKDNPNKPECCDVVPILADRVSWESVKPVMEELAAKGSQASPGFMGPEGVVGYHYATKSMFKMTLDNRSKFEKDKDKIEL